MEEFIKTYSKILNNVNEAGIRNAPIRVKTEERFLDQKHTLQFLKGCHRGFDKAQNALVNLIANIRKDTELTTNEKKFRERLLRKLADNISIYLFGDQSHVIRRLAMHDNPPHLNMDTLFETLKIANNLNSESRKTFALINDLTTFIHVSDITRIDFRERHPVVSFIELKSGNVNRILLEKLGDL